MESNDRIQYEPIKIPRSMKYGNNYWNSRGNKVGNRNIELYSDLEFDHWLTVETNPKVITYCEQPLKISYVLKGQLRTSIFDMWILNQDGSETFVEVKYEKELTSNLPKYDRTKRQIEAQQEWCRINNKAYEVRTEKTIRSGRHSVENRTSIVTAVLNSTKPACTLDVLHSISFNKRTISDITQELTQYSVAEVNLALKWLYYEGHVCANIEDQIFGNGLEVYKRE
ncbi:Tn7 transposase TnsA N-terminal domain-containing protein [Paenibacillus sp. FSL H8-0317]|uniref:Tn7 transposase TnsA N-terminal domain-containing protein n=1 Tax=Paenibacillus sp. FSL H8-0317 TaxID=2921385 RepID=UPI00324D6930